MNRELRAVLAKAVPGPLESACSHALGCRSADFSLKGGLRCGVLHEIFAAPGHETAAAGFACAATLLLSHRKPFLWIQQDFSALEHGELAATGLLELGADPSRVLVLRVPDAESALRAAGDALSTPALGAVLIEVSGEPKILNLVTSRRLTLAVARHGVTALLLRFGAQPDASTAETRWLVRGAPSQPDDENWGRPAFDTDLVRNRNGSTGHWVMEWSCDDGIFRERAAASGAVVSTPFDRQAASALEGERTFRAPV